MDIWNPVVGLSKSSNQLIILQVQNKCFRQIVGAYRYTSNEDIQRYLKIQTIHEVASTQAARHERRLLNHLYRSNSILLLCEKKTKNRLVAHHELDRICNAISVI